MRTFFTLACLMLLSFMTFAADLVIQAGGPTIVPTGNYGTIEYKSGAQAYFQDGHYNIQNNNTNEKGILIQIESTAKGNFGNINSPGGLTLNNYSSQMKFKNIELQNGTENHKNVFNVYGETDTQVIQISDCHSTINIIGCSAILTTNGHASLNGQTQYHAVHLVNGGQWLANGGMSVDVANPFYGRGYVRINGSPNIHAHFTDAEVYKIQVCIKGHLQSWEYTKYLDNVKLSCDYVCDPMPVTLVSFNAKKESNVAQLNWVTAEETNSDKFEIQRSHNGKNWNVIGELKSHQESKTTQTYNFTDVNVRPGSNLYRLKMVDLDETFTYSTLAEVTFDIPSEFNVYPNPSTGTIDITNKSKIQTAAIYSLTGVLIWEGNPSHDAIKALKSGLYVIKYTSVAGSTSTQKITVL
jgi:hypothetical protein